MDTTTPYTATFTNTNTGRETVKAFTTARPFEAVAARFASYVKANPHTYGQLAAPALEREIEAFTQPRTGYLVINELP